MMAEFAAILFSMILVNNYVLVKFLGVCPFLACRRNSIRRWAWAVP